MVHSIYFWSGMQRENQLHYHFYLTASLIEHFLASPISILRYIYQVSIFLIFQSISSLVYVKSAHILTTNSYMSNSTSVLICKEFKVTCCWRGYTLFSSLRMIVGFKIYSM